LPEQGGRGLVNGDGTPAVPDLFEAVADSWAPRGIPLGTTSHPDGTVRSNGGTGGSRPGLVTSAMFDHLTGFVTLTGMTNVLRMKGTP